MRVGRILLEQHADGILSQLGFGGEDTPVRDRSGGEAAKRATGERDVHRGEQREHLCTIGDCPEFRSVPDRPLEDREHLQRVEDVPQRLLVDEPVPTARFQLPHHSRRCHGTLRRSTARTYRRLRVRSFINRGMPLTPF